ncbi:MAG TPA: methyl-accepting chemotaxis protein, partial [Polyangiales bacterium]|nr:methyl-accepting chemotaxis protein [Polyangiales bacterium]
MLEKLTIRKKLLYLLTVLMFGLGAECYVIESTVSQVRVHGPAYKRITATKDLIADILPPPAFIVETYLLAHEQLEEPNASARQKLTEQIQVLQRSFEERHAFWRKKLEHSDLRDKFGVDSYLPAQRFFNSYQQSFLPALAANDIATARAVLRGPLKSAFDEHEQRIKQLADDATRHVSDEENEAAREASAGMLASAVGLGILAVIAVLTTLLVLSSIEKPMLRVRELFTAMANRDLTPRSESGSGRNDEFGEMTRLANAAIESMREVLRSMAEQSDSLAGASEELRVVSEHMSANAEET